MPKRLLEEGGSYRRHINAKLPCERLVAEGLDSGACAFAGLARSANFGHLLFRQLEKAIAPTHSQVAHVVGLGSCKQVQRIDAARVVAGVANDLAANVFNGQAVMKNVSNAMDALLLLLVKANTVAGSAFLLVLNAVCVHWATPSAPNN